MNIIEAIKEFQTGKYEYMTHPKGPWIQYSISQTNNVLAGATSCHLHLDFLEGWEMGPKKKEKKTGWINIYQNGTGSKIHRTRDVAREHSTLDVIDTIEITWYE